jgi:UDP-N-acetylglucosamine--N-acetylmuramyl-(pentapeptide) pyrophosphoryl-undecaprenol N-acetylglucosamine transferase
MTRAGAAIAIPDGELTGERLGREVAQLLADPVRMEAMAQASAALARPHAARDIAAELLDAAALG